MIRLAINGKDYSKYLIPTVSPTVNDSLNVAKEFTCSIYPKDSLFSLVTQGMPVRFYSDNGTVWFTGYVSTTPHLSLVAPGYSGYNIIAESEDWKFNQIRVGSVSDFVNQYAGDILKSLIFYAAPNTTLDFSNVSQGPMLTEFTISPSWTFADAAEALVNAIGWRWYILDGKVYLLIQNDKTYPISVNNNDSAYNSEGISASTSDIDVISDVTINGPLEPQMFVTDAYCGDGQTSSFELSSSFFGNASSFDLLNDNFVSSSWDTNNWMVNDPNNSISYKPNVIKIAGGANLGKCVVAAKQSLEMGGEIEINHGSFSFDQLSIGIMGGVYQDNTFTHNKCIAGFGLSTNPMTTGIQAIINGQSTGNTVISNKNHAYELISYFSMDQVYRSIRAFPSILGRIGGYSNISNGYITLIVRDYDLNSPLAPYTEIVLYDDLVSSVPSTAIYALFNAQSSYLNHFKGVNITYLPNIRVRTQTPSGYTRENNFSVINSNNAWEVVLTKALPPAGGILLTYRSSGEIKTRLVNYEIKGKSVTLDASTLVRTTLEAELLTEAILINHKEPLYEGQYQTNPAILDTKPESGEYIGVTITGFPQFVSLVTSAKTVFTDLTVERGTILTTFGFAKLIPSYPFSTSASTVSPNDFRNAPACLDSYPSYSVASVNGTNITVNMDRNPAYVFESRFETLHRTETDDWEGLSAAPQETTNSNTFLLPRSSRSDCYYLRELDGAGKSSRYSSLITTIGYPTIPAPPHQATILVGLSVQFVFNLTNLNDVYGIEIRQPDNTVIYSKIYNNTSDLTYSIDNVSLQRNWDGYKFYTFNSRNEYSAVLIASGDLPIPVTPVLTRLSTASLTSIVSISSDPRTDLTQQIVEVAIHGAPTDWSSIVLSDQRNSQFGIDTLTLPSSGDWDIRCRKADVLGFGNNSAPITVTVVDVNDLGIPSVPAGVSLSTGVVVDGVGQVFAYIDVSWTANTETGLTGYRVRYDKNDGNYAYVNADLSINPKIRIHPLPCDTAFYFSVASVHTKISSSYSTAISTTTAKNSSVVVGLPSSIKCIGGFRVVGLSWTAPADKDINHYNVRRYKGSVSPSIWTTIPIAIQTSSAYVVDKGDDGGLLAINSDYFYGISSVNSSGVESVIVVSSKVTTTAIGDSDMVANTIMGDKIYSQSITATQINVGTIRISGNQITTGALSVGGGASMPGKLEVFDGSGVSIGLIGQFPGGTTTPWGGLYGGWFPNLAIGGSSVSNANLWTDNAGNIHMYGGTIVGPNGTAIDTGGNLKLKNIIRLTSTTNPSPTINTSGFADISNNWINNNGVASASLAVTTKGNPLLIATELNLLSQTGASGEITDFGTTFSASSTGSAPLIINVIVGGDGTGASVTCVSSVLGGSYPNVTFNYDFIFSYGSGYTRATTTVTVTVPAGVNVGYSAPAPGTYPCTAATGGTSNPNVPISVRVIDETSNIVMGPTTLITDSSGNINYKNTQITFAPSGNHTYHIQAWNQSSNPAIASVQKFYLIELG